MGVEIERKFLVRDESWQRPALPSHRIRQGYLTPPDSPLSIRIRIVDARSAVITLKTGSGGVRRNEYEYPVPLEDAEALIVWTSGSVIEKTRFVVTHRGTRWEIDRFEGDNAGLVIAEVELAREDVQIDLPDWVGTEVSEDARYLNASLSVHPFSRW